MKSVAVVGAGAFGAWTALHLARAGMHVTLLEAYGPGNSRSSSGGETRVIRMGYGSLEIYTRFALRALDLWKELFAGSGAPLFLETGVLWMAREGDPLTLATRATLQKYAVPHQLLVRSELEQRWPQVDFGPIAWGIYEPNSGILLARRAVQETVRACEHNGVRVLRAQAIAPCGSGRADAILTASGETVRADAFVFACGPWLPKLFPEILRERIFVTRQETFYFGTPPGDGRFSPPALPAWVDFGQEMYGIPDVEARGFKIAVDRHGPPFDLDSPERISQETFAEARHYLDDRFPALRDAPLLAVELCQYENTSNGDFLIDRHPAFENVWLVGGGSGHGFKHAPAVGETITQHLLDGVALEECFLLSAKAKVQRRGVY
ncbi:MAG TPA: FAD-dependent oxidoreductase [bacterium]|nr:FAD-dependent oxidoreductase [bacterium]